MIYATNEMIKKNRENFSSGTERAQQFYRLKFQIIFVVCRYSTIGRFSIVFGRFVTAKHLKNTDSILHLFLAFLDSTLLLSRRPPPQIDNSEISLIFLVEMLFDNTFKIMGIGKFFTLNTS